MLEAIRKQTILASRLRTLRVSLELTIEDAARVLGVAPRTITRKEHAETALTVAEGDRAYRLARVADLAVEMIGDESKAKAWLHRPSAFLGERSPLESLETEIGTERVLGSLYAIGYGGVG